MIYLSHVRLHLQDIIHCYFYLPSYSYPSSIIDIKLIFEEKSFECVWTFNFLLTSRILDHSPRSSKDFEKCDAPERNYNWIRTVYRKAMNTATNTYVYLELYIVFLLILWSKNRCKKPPWHAKGPENRLYSYAMIETFTFMMYYHEKV